jgi:DNA topoisomerase VI subunit A
VLFRSRAACASAAAARSHTLPCAGAEKETERAFADTSQVRKAAIMTRVMGLVHELCKRGIHSTKRDIFYTDVKLFKKQEESDGMRHCKA